MKPKVHKLGIQSGERLSKLRLEHDLFQSDFADIAGIHRKTLGDIELGKHATIRESALDAIADAFHVDRDWILGPPTEPRLTVGRRPHNYDYNIVAGSDRALDVGAGYPGRLREARKTIGWTQQELAEEAGVSVLTVVRHELGHVLPAKAVLYALADAISAPASWLYGPPGEAKLKDLIITGKSALPYGKIRQQRANGELANGELANGELANGDMSPDTYSNEGDTDCP